MLGATKMVVICVAVYCQDNDSETGDPHILFEVHCKFFCNFVRYFCCCFYSLKCIHRIWKT